MTDGKSKQLRTYVQFGFPYGSDKEPIRREVQDRDFRKVEIPDGAQGFCFFDLAQGKEMPQNQSPYYRLAKRIMTVEEIRLDPDATADILSCLDSLTVKAMMKSLDGVFELLPVAIRTKVIVINEEKKVLYPPDAVEAAARARAEENIIRLRQQKAAKSFTLRKP